MGRRYAIIARLDPISVWFLTFFLLVLREIEQEDNLWHEKHKSAQKSEKITSEAEKQPTQRSKGKEPAAASAEDESKKTPSTRKVNFF